MEHYRHDPARGCGLMILAAGIALALIAAVLLWWLLR